MTIVLLIVIAAAFLWVVTAYNRLVDLRARAYAAWRELEIHLARRSELSARLVDAMKGAVDHERERLDRVLAARSEASVARHQARPTGGIAALAAAEAKLANALARLTVVPEQYPHVKTTGTIGQLLEELRATEERFSLAREHYTEAATAYNSMQRHFPEQLMATLARSESVEPWATGETDRSAATFETLTNTKK